MQKILFWLCVFLWLWWYSFAQSGITLQDGLMQMIPFQYTISFLPNDTLSKDSVIEDKEIITTDTLYSAGTLITSYVYPRADGFAFFEKWSCTDYIARQRPDLFLNSDGSRRITGNAEDRLYNAKKLWLKTWANPQKWSIAVYYEWRWWREYWHVAYVEQVQSNGVIIVSEMNYTDDYVVSIRAVDSKLAAGYIY